jgi:hypothetical protein
MKTKLFPILALAMMFLTSCGDGGKQSGESNKNATSGANESEKNDNNVGEGTKMSIIEFVNNLTKEYAIYKDEYNGKTFTFENVYIRKIQDNKNGRAVFVDAILLNDTWDDLSKEPQKKEAGHAYYLKTRNGKNYKIEKNIGVRINLADPKQIKKSEVIEVDWTAEFKGRHTDVPLHYEAPFGGQYAWAYISKETVPLYRVTGTYQNEKGKLILVDGSISEMK